MRGINYPWSAYGCDFGANIWRSHVGVSTHLEDIHRDFAAMAAIGVQVVRWFVFTDGRGGIRWNADGGVEGLATGFFEDMDAALDIARSVDVRLCLVLFDYAWMLHREERDASGTRLFVTHPTLLATESGQARMLASIVGAIVDRYGSEGGEHERGTAIHSIDVINEPDWVTRGLAPDRSQDDDGERRLRRPFTKPELRALVRGIADRVHAKTPWLVTVGGGRVRFAAEWDRPDYGLDFVQVHSYPDRRHPRRDLNLIDCSRESLGVSKPVLIGECPANGDRLHPPGHLPPHFSLEDYLGLADERGYLGAWPWSFRGVDPFGRVDADAMRQWIASGRLG